MRTITQHLCGVIPPHILERLAARSADQGAAAKATLAQTREIAAGRTGFPVGTTAAAVSEAIQSRKRRRHVYDAQQKLRLPGKLVMSEHKTGTGDVEANEAYHGCGGTYDFYDEVFDRRSIDNRGMRLDSTVHYGERFSNALWNGEQMIYGDGDGEIFNRFTASIEVIGHELTHGVTQYTAKLDYSGQTGALNEHISDAFGIMVKQWLLGLSVKESDWLIGAELFTPNVNAIAVRSMSEPGTAYDDPILGRDPQPAHMDDYVETDEDNGGVHINSGILNRAFYLAAREVGGYAWEIVGYLWYVALTERLRPDADFRDFARATTDVAGERYGMGGAVQCIVRDAWEAVGLQVPLYGISRRLLPAAAAAAPSPLSKWRQRPAR